MESYISATMILLYSDIWTRKRHRKLWKICMQASLGLTLVDTLWPRKSRGMVTIGPQWKLIVIITQGLATNVKTRETPFSLVYGMEAFLRIEVQIPSLRIMKEAGLGEDIWIQTRLDQLNLIDEKRLDVVYHGQMYQKIGRASCRERV